MIEKVQNNQKYMIDAGMMELFSNAVERIPRHILDNNSALKDLGNFSRSKDLQGFRKRFFELYAGNTDELRSSMSALEREI